MKIITPCQHCFAAVIAKISFLVMVGFAAYAQPLSLSLPIKCTPGTDCWLVNLVDHDPTRGMLDFRCTEYGYNGHTGTDIAIRDRAAMLVGVPVLAAAPGVVMALRDGMPDRVPSAEFKRTKRNFFCGNKVVIRHVDGWETQYCHLRRGSVMVKNRQWVNRGQQIGFVGHSGMATFPHIHLSVWHLGRVIDPFVGAKRKTACGASEAPLWSDASMHALSRPMTAIYSIGFAPKSPNTDEIRNGLFQDPALSSGAPALVLWAEVFWVEAGDRVRLRITGPNGEAVIDSKNVSPKRQARRLIFAGRKKRGLFWPGGNYHGEIVIERRDASGQTQRFTASRHVELKGLRERHE